MRILSRIAATVFLALAALTNPAAAGLVIRAPEVPFAAGESGSFDLVLVAESDTPLLGVTGFTTAITFATSSGITITGFDDDTTAPYLFGNSAGYDSFGLDGFQDTSNPLETRLVLFDSILGPGTQPVMAGDVFGLARIRFLATAGSGSFTITVDRKSPDGTSEVLAPSNDPDNPDPVNVLDRVEDGAFVSSALTPVPEPSNLVSIAVGLAAVIPWAFRRARRPADRG